MWSDSHVSSTLAQPGAVDVTRRQAWPSTLVHFVLSSIRTFGRLVDLCLDSVVGCVADARARRFQWRETLHQIWYLISVTAVPAVLMAVPFGVVISVQVGNLVHQIGADSLLGAASGQGVIQQGAPIATGLLLGGAGASAIAADLGARTVRDEVDALRAMGINPVHRLVVPRLIAMMFVAPLLNILVIFVGVVAGFLVAVGPQGVTPGSYWASFGAFSTTVDVWVSSVKAIVFGFIVATIACQRGMEARGGPGGVANGVNAAVVLSVVGVIVVNVVATQLVMMFQPQRVA